MAAVDLVFRTPLGASQGTPVDLVFGDPAVELGNVNVTIEATFPAPTLSALVAKPVLVEIAATMPAPTLAAEVFYDNAVFRGTVARAASDWQDASNAESGATVPSDQGAKTQTSNRVPWGATDRLHADTAMPHADAIRLRGAGIDTGWRGAIGLRAQTTGAYADALRHARISREARHADADRLGALKTGDHWIDLYRHARPRRVAPWGEGIGRRLDQHHRYQEGKPHRMQRQGPWGDAVKPPPGLFFIPIIPPEPEGTCYDVPPGGQVALLFDQASPASPHLIFLCPGEAPDATVTVPVRRAYIVINDVHLRRVSNNLDLPCLSLSLNIDADSWTWSFSASLPAAELANIEPAGFGDPVELDAQINGIHYRLFAESISRDRTFGSSRITVSGRGKSAILAEPYSPLVSFTNGQERTAQQLMGDVLTTNGAPLGWSVDWQVTDWIVPAGVFSHQGSYMSAVNAIAGAIGGYIQPHPTANTLRVLNRYPTAPWEWGTVTPDFELPSAAVSKEGFAWEDKPAYNAVYLSGTAGGVLSQVKRTGSAGDILAPMVTDALLTRTDAHRQRGIAILGDTGRIATVTLTLPVLQETGVIEPGKFVRYVDGATTRLGIVRSTSVESRMPTLRQTLEVETHA